MSLPSVNPAMAPLSERFTLVVITHNRSAFLRRTLEYYRAFAGRILVLDSSTQAEPDVEKNWPDVDYRHLPQFSYSGLQDKLTYGVSLVTTPFMAFVAVDDFILPGAIDQCVDFLDLNPDYGVCHGYGLMYISRATEVLYFRRDLKVQADYGSQDPEVRVMQFMEQFQPPFYAVVRTDLLRNWYQLLPQGVNFEWQEIGHSFYLLACAKSMTLDITYIVRELNYGGSEHGTNVLTVLAQQDARSVAEREQFAAFLASIPTGLSELGAVRVKQIALDSFTAMTKCLLTASSLKISRLFRSQWQSGIYKPVRLFDPYQCVEMPFYNQALFDQLTEIEFLMHAMPAGRQQLEELEGVLVRQQALLRHYPDDTHETVQDRLWQALDCSAFNSTVVERLVQSLERTGLDASAEDLSAVKQLQAWFQRLATAKTVNMQAFLDSTPSGHLLRFLAARVPDSAQAGLANKLVQQKNPPFEILLLDLESDAAGLQATFDSLLACNLKAFKVVVFTAGDVPAITNRKDTVHFVKVNPARYVERLNEIAADSTADWLLLAEAGDEFTASGLLRAALELRGVEGCRAVAMDEIHRQDDGALRDIFRPGFNLDLLLNVPGLMSRHWLIHKDALLEVGGYNPDFDQALEFDLLLRIIEQGGMAGLAHLAEPLLIGKAARLEKNDQYAKTLARHLEVRGYSAQVTSSESGTLHVDYRHAERPLVSIVLHSQDNFKALQLCLISVLQRTRYHHHEILIADNHSQDPELHEWLEQLETKGERIRVLRLERAVSPAALLNLACQQARGEYLLLLASDAQVVTANWVEVLLNQAQRPEVGVVGAKLVDEKGRCTQACLVLGFDQGIGVTMVGESKGAKGYMQRLLVEQNCSAVSGVCMMVRKALFDTVGGFDEGLSGENFAVVDLCLKLDTAGYLTVWTPHAQVLHHGVLPISCDEVEALRSKWPVPMQGDRAYNPNHLQAGKAFVPGAPQPVAWGELLG